MDSYVVRTVFPSQRVVLIFGFCNYIKIHNVIVVSQYMYIQGHLTLFA